MRCFVVQVKSDRSDIGSSQPVFNVIATFVYHSRDFFFSDKFFEFSEYLNQKYDIYPDLHWDAAYVDCFLDSSVERHFGVD